MRHYKSGSLKIDYKAFEGSLFKGFFKREGKMKKKTTLRLIAATVMTAFVTIASGTNAYAAVTSAGSISNGIDVSKFNGVVDWGKIAGSGVKFAFVRVGNPQSGVDPMFAANFNGASGAGLRTGVYYYSHATSVEAAKAEAAQTIEWLKGYPVSYPVVYDVEAGGQKKLGAAQMQDIVNTYCSIIYAAGYYPMVYTNKNFYKSKLMGNGWDRWIAQYGSSCDMDSVAFWQYSSKGKLPGIGGYVDLNLQYKDYSKAIVKDGFAEQYGFVRYYSNWMMQRGWVSENGLKFHMNDMGVMESGWFTDTDSKVYYLNPNGGYAVTGLQTIDGAKYIFDANCVKCTGITEFNGALYYCDPITGALLCNGSFTFDGMNFVTTGDGVILPAL